MFEIDSNKIIWADDSVIQLSLLVSSYCMSIATHHIRIVSDSILPKKYSPKNLHGNRKKHHLKMHVSAKNDDFPACHVRLAWRVMPAFHVSSPTQNQVVLKPLTYKKKTQLSFESPKKNKMASLKGQVRDCLQFQFWFSKICSCFHAKVLAFRNMTCSSLNQKKHT